MKKQTLLTIAALLVFGLGAGTLAYQQNTHTATTAMSCCCKGDSCPMKKKDVSVMEAASCCDNCDCCKGEGSCTGDSCPMKKKGEKPHTMSAAMTSATAVKGDEGCCCSCCAAKKDG